MIVVVRSIACFIFLPLAFACSGEAENLYRESAWSSLAADNKAAQVGDILTVAVFQAAEARNSAQNTSRRESEVGGQLRGGSHQQSGDITFGGRFTGSGEIRRSGSVVAQIGVVVVDVFPNGDLQIEGEQFVFVNGEETIVGVRGRVRPVDITSENIVFSSRIANAEINYDGSGFVSRSAKPGIISRLFSFLGLG